jgi:hypothetical protein
MMACNDVAVANQCLSKFREENSQLRKHVRLGALMYFVRLQCGHLNEAIKLIQEIRDDTYLYERVKPCSKAAQDSFVKLLNCLNGGSDNKKFLKYVGRIRHNTAFHYDPKVIEKALADRASRPEARYSKITLGDDISLWRFELADQIVDSVVCRQIWKIPKNADLRKEADECADFGSDLCKALLDFSGEFIFRYIQEHAAT